MKQKILRGLFTLAGIAAGVTLILTGCGEDHVHTYSREWSQNETSHWHCATCEHTDLTMGKGNHADADRDGICDVCGYVIEDLHVHTFEEAWTSDANGHWHKATCTHSEEKDSFGAHVDEDEDNKCDICEYTLPAHTHTFDESGWLFDEVGHWRLPTCGHTEERGEYAEHIDGDQDGNCDICGYNIPVHEHTFDILSWEKDETGHWHKATCSHADLKGGFAAHSDADEDELCDVCGYSIPHVHTVSDEWTYDESTHWHAATCRHHDYIEDETPHEFRDGECECGIKKVQVDVYGIYAEREAANAKSFADWQKELDERGVIGVRLSASGDVIYEYDGGETEVVYVAARTAKVQAQTFDGTPLAHFWFKISIWQYEGKVEGATIGSYLDMGGTDALEIAETDESGIATFVFEPLKGFTSETYQYIIRPAEAKDLAKKQDILEEEAMPMPDRYIWDTESEGAVRSAEVIVAEALGPDEIVGKFIFNPSNAWRASRKPTLPYARYYTDPLNGTGLTEKGTTYTLSATGNGFYDYFYFVPSQKYSLNTDLPNEDKIKIIENYQKAASGVYKISFQADADVQLIFWNENVELDAFYQEKPDGSPEDRYITSRSGGTAGDGKYTGGNYVEVIVSPERALRQYTLGFISDAACRIAVTVERTGDYTVPAGNELVWRDGMAETLTKWPGYSKISIDLVNVPAGIYLLDIKNVQYDNTETYYRDQGITAYFDPTVIYRIYRDHISQGIIRVFEGDTKLILDSALPMGSSDKHLTLTPYELPTLEKDAETDFPITSKNETRLPLSFGASVTAGSYLLKVRIYDSRGDAGYRPLTVMIGETVYPLRMPLAAENATFRAEIAVEIKAGDMISISSDEVIYNYQIFVTLTANG